MLFARILFGEIARAARDSLLVVATACRQQMAVGSDASRALSNTK